MACRFAHMILLVLGVAGAMWLTGCSQASAYNPDECTRVARRVSMLAPLGQTDYAEMIAQSEEIYKYLINVAEQPADDDNRPLRENEEFMKRLDYMFTFSSVLYRAHLDGQLDAANTSAYENLDRYADHFAQICAAL